MFGAIASVAGGIVGTVLGDKIGGIIGGSGNSGSAGAASNSMESVFANLGKSNASILSDISNLTSKDGVVDDKALLAAQHQVQMKQQMISTISNMMKSLHEMAMTIINSLRL